MTKWIPKNKILKLASAAALFSLVLYFGVLFMVFKEIGKVEDLYSNTESEYFKGNKFWAIQSLAETNKDAIQKLRNFFIQKGDEVGFIEQIEKEAKDSSIQFDIGSIDVREDKENAFKEDVEVKMMIEGPWSNMISFVDRLEKMPFGVLVKNLNLDADSSKGWSGSVDFIIFREK
jgi:hypothetical protein